MIPIFESQLTRHLPLRNLYWNSNHRPLRSIDILDVALLPEYKGPQNVSERRHQIPGLRQTPYVKLYLLKCDDTEAYKETCRNQIKQWVKEVAAPRDRKASRISVDQHDAFEWLIIHVVLPDTPAAVQALTTKDASLGTSDSTENVPGKSRWPGKSSMTLFDRLRADFNDSSRSALERVAQIRVSKDQMTGAVRSAKANIEELPGQWDELINKLKAAILKSFSTRVSQYEDDIQQRELQKNFPGWNFCTYFILKEGLAHVFENVGLLKDAEALYDELEVELDVLTRRHAGHNADGQHSLLPFSKDLKAKIRAALNDSQVVSYYQHHAFEDMNIVSLLQTDAGVTLLDLYTSRYKEKILANEISHFDLQVHLFTRQLALLTSGIREVNSKKNADASAKSSKLLGSDAISKAVKILERGMRFVGLATQSMRSELYNAWGGQYGLNTEDTAVQEVVVGNIVASWTWRIILQLIQVTDVMALTSGNASALGDHLRPSSRTDSLGDSAVTSVAMNAGVVAQETVGSTHQAASNATRGDPQALKAAKNVQQVGCTQLATYRAQLYLQAREILKRVWQFDNLAPPWDDKPFQQGAGIKDQNTCNSTTSKEVRIRPEKLSGIEPDTLRLASESPTATTQMYAKLTELALGQFRAAGAIHSATKALADLAMVSHWSRDFTAAASYCSQVLDLVSVTPAGFRDRRLLLVYCNSLKGLERTEDYLKFSLELLSLYSTELNERGPDEKSSLVSCVRDILMACKQLESPLTMPLDSVFIIEDSPASILYMAAEIGFVVSLQVRSEVLTGVEINVEGMIKLKAMADNQPAHIDLFTNPAVNIGLQPTRMDFYSNIEVLGWYQIEVIELRIANARFIKIVALGQDDIARPAVGLMKPMLLYPSEVAPSVRLLPALTYNLACRRELRLEIGAGAAPLNDFNLQIEPVIGELRLRTEEIRPETENIRVIHLPNNKHRLENIPAAAKAALSLPYSVDNGDTSEISVHVVLEYISHGKAIFFHTTVRVDTSLPLSVNVRGVFTTSALFSCFTIAATELVPLHIRGCEIQEDASRENGNSSLPEPATISPGQPVLWTHRFGLDDANLEGETTNKPRLTIDFQNLEEVVLSALEEQLRTDLSNSHLSKLSAVLSAHLAQSYRVGWTAQDLENFQLSHEVELWKYEKMDWNLTLSGLHIDTQRKAQLWLRRWHQNLHFVSLALSTAPVRRVSMSIDFPTPEIILSSSLRVAQKDDADSFIEFGEASASEFSLSYHKVWRNSARGNLGAIDIHFEIMPVPDSWLVGGTRKGSIRLQELHTQRINLLLIPQKVGYLPLPKIDLQCFDATKEFQVGFSSQAYIAFEHEDLTEASNILVISSRPYTTTTIADAIDTAKYHCSTATGDVRQ